MDTVNTLYKTESIMDFSGDLNDQTIEWVGGEIYYI